MAALAQGFPVARSPNRDGWQSNIVYTSSARIRLANRVQDKASRRATLAMVVRHRRLEKHTST
jgi:hypothetical protein